MTMIFDAIGEPVARRVTSGLAKIGLVLKVKAWKGAVPAGVTPTQGQALALLRDAPDGLRLRALAELLGISAPSASEAINSLVAKGYARREPGPDKRSISLKLTHEGAVLADRTAEWPDFLVRAVAALEPGEQAGFLRSLLKIIRTLQENGDVPLQRMCVTCRYFRAHAHDDALDPHHCSYVDAPFGDRHLRLSCPEHEEAEGGLRQANWECFSAQREAQGGADGGARTRTP